MRGGYSLRPDRADGSATCARLPFAACPLHAVRLLLADDPLRASRKRPARSHASPPRSARRAAILGAIDLVRVDDGSVVRDVTVARVDAEHGARIVEAVRALDGIEVLSVSDRTFLLHRGGKIEVTPRCRSRRRDDLSMAYTPGVARVCMAIHDDPSSGLDADHQGQHRRRRHRRHRGARPRRHRRREAAMPVMEGKAMLFKEFGGVDALPICLDTKDTDEIVAIVKAHRARLRRHQPRGHRGAALLRDRAAAAGRARHPGLPRRPARHRHRRAGGAHQRAEAGRQGGRRRPRRHGRRRRGRHRGRRHAARPTASATSSAATARARSTPAARASTPSAAWFAERTNPRRLRRHDRRGAAPAPTSPSASPARARSRPTPCARWPTARSCSRSPTRRPRCSPRTCREDVAVIATGRSDYPNQINNVLAFPGIFRGALDVARADDQRGDEAGRRRGDRRR